MTKIIELINFHTAYGSQVNLHDNYYGDSDNLNRMSGYMPIKAHRKAFEKLANAQLTDSSNQDKVFLLTGSFGTGKSHLCLMLANYFARPVESSEVKSFLQNWERKDIDIARYVRNIRGEGRYLVAICDFGTPRPFEDMVLTSIEEALEREGVEEIATETHYHGALRLIEEWQSALENGQQVGVYHDFLQKLDGADDDTGIERLVKELRANSSRAMDTFQQVYRSVTGQRFTMNNDNLKAVLEDLLKQPQFKERYRGLVILADEFGYALQENKVPMSVFQSFAELTRNRVDGLPIIFVGVAHRSFSAYANSGMLYDFKVVQDRVTEVTLESEELEQIIAALVSPKIGEDVWINQIQNNPLLERMANESVNVVERKFKLFENLTSATLREQIITNIYPMHPLSIYCLTKMSQDLGSDARSVFSFFRQGAGEGSFVWFANNSNIVDEIDGSRQLNIYTPDLLANYFAPEIRSAEKTLRESIREAIRNYQHGLEHLEKLSRSSFHQQIDPIQKKVLDLLFVMKVSNVPMTASNLAFGLNFYRQDQKHLLEAALKELKNSNILFQGRTGELEFRRSDMADIESMINRHRELVEQSPINLVDKLITIADAHWEKFLPASGYNSPYSEDKRMSQRFASPADLSRTYPRGNETFTYWEMIEQDRLNVREWKDTFEGTMVFVVCETSEDILKAQQAVKSNVFGSILAGVLLEPLPIREKILDFLAIENFKADHEFDKLDSQEKSIVEEKYGKETNRSGYIGEVIKVRERYLSGQNQVWYGKNGIQLISKPSANHQPVDLLFKNMYSKRNTQQHNLFNQVHKNLNIRDAALRQAIDRLIDYGQPVEIDGTEAESQGQIRYLRNVLVSSGVLRKSSENVGNKTYYEITTYREDFKNTLPALFDYLEYLSNLAPGSQQDITSKLRELISPPYGIGLISLAMYFAVGVRFMGDEMRAKLQATNVGYTPLDNVDTVINLATLSNPLAVIERVAKTPDTIDLVDGIYKIFSEILPSAGTHQTNKAAGAALQAWWQTRSKLEQTSGLYNENSPARTLAAIMTEKAHLPEFANIFLDEIKGVGGYSSIADLNTEVVEVILKLLSIAKNEMETSAGLIKSEVITSISQLFSPTGITYTDYTEGIRTWCNLLTHDQLDKQASWQTSQTKTLLEALPKFSDIEKLLLEDLPAYPSFSLGKVNDWNYNKSTEFLEKFSAAKEAIDNGLPKITTPSWGIRDKVNDGGDNTKVYDFNGVIEIWVEAAQEADARVCFNEIPLTAKQFELIPAHSKKSITINKSGDYYLASIANGESSKVIKIKFHNRDDDYKVIPAGTGQLFPADRFYQYRNPADTHALKELMSNMIKQLTDDKVLTQTEIFQTIQEVLDSKTQKGNPD